VELTRQDLVRLLLQKPLAGLDMLAALAEELSDAQHLVRERSAVTPMS